MAKALDSIRVVEFATGVAGPFAGKLLAGMGADVIKVEPPEGDPTRREGPFLGDVQDPDRSGLFLHLNTGKRSLVGPADLGDQLRFVRDLLEVADVFLIDARPATLRAAGIDLDKLHHGFPQLLIVSVTPFGVKGPYADYLGSELIEYAVSGQMFLTGSPNRKPIKAYGHLVEYLAGAQAALGALAGVHALARTGRGQIVDVSAMEAGMFVLGGLAQKAFFYGDVTRRNGARLSGFPPEHFYPSTIRACKDGYVHCHANLHHPDLLEALIGNSRLGEPDLLAAQQAHADEIDAILDGWLVDKERREVVELAQLFRLPFTEVLEPGEVMTDEHNVQRQSFVRVVHPIAGAISQPGAPFRLYASPWETRPAPLLGGDTQSILSAGKDAFAIPKRQRAETTLRAAKSLAGVRVVDFTLAVAGPTASSILGTLGAEVIKVESPAGRPSQAVGAAPVRTGCPDRSYNRIMLFNEVNHDKLGISLDASHTEGRELLLKLVAASDVVVQNFAPRVLPNLRLTYEDLCSARPDIILVSMPAFGLSGPYCDRLAYGPGIDAMSGLSFLTGYVDGAPLKAGNFICDQSTGVYAALATLAALRHRSLTGEGQHVELAMLEAEFQFMGDAYIDYFINGRKRTRVGNDHPAMAPHDVFPCMGEDAWVAIAVENDEQWKSLCSAIGRAELASDPRFALASDRHAGRKQLHDPISAWTRERNPYEAQSILQAAGVPAGAVLTVADLLADPHVAARGTFQYMDAPEIGSTPVLRAAFTMSETPILVERPAPMFAEHNASIYSGLIGLDPEELHRLEATRVLASTPLDRIGTTS